MKIIITGGSGFIGTNLCLNLVKEGYSVLNIDKEQPKVTSVAYKNIDITNVDELHNAIVTFAPDYIVHLAARTDLKGGSIEDYAANTKGVENVMKIAHHLSELKKIIITSSMLVCRSGYLPADQFDYAPTTIYGQSKVTTEKIVWANKPNCDWAIIRPTSIWGPWFDEPYKNFFDMILSKRYFHIGNKSCTKTYGYVGNAIYQIEKILFTDTYESSNKVFYIGDYIPTNIEEWGNEIAKELNMTIHKIPYSIMKTIAFLGDSLKRLNIDFPMSSFRLRNMTTDNIVNMSPTELIAPTLPFSRIEGVRKTLKWMKKIN